MDNQRVLLFFALSFVLLLIWQAWQQDNMTQEQPATPATAEQVATEQIPQTSSSEDVPASPPGGAQMETSDILSAAQASQEVLKKGQRIRVRTDVLDVEIDTVGGDIRQVDLLAYPVSADEPDHPFRLMEDSPLRVFIAQTGLLSKQSAPDHHARFTAEQTEYVLPAGADQIQVPLRWTSEDGITVTKTYTFKRDSYVIDIAHTVDNGSTEEWRGHQYRQFQRTEPADYEKSTFIYTYTGAVIYSEEEKYEKIDFDDMKDGDLSRDIKGGWAAMIQHYFVGAWLPREDELNHFYTKAPKGRPFILGLVSAQDAVAPGAQKTFASRVFIGPKEQHRLEKLAPGLELTVDYGVLTVLAKPIFWLMEYIHALIGNWGFTIIILTLIIKLVFYKLSAASYRSMANMRKLQPKIVAMRERYGDDRQRMSQAMMELYKKEKINPMGGCLPMLVQIPVFIALYWVLLESVELRQADFIFWLNDLSSRDPYYILPLLMGATMFIQQKLNPPPPDPIQAKIMTALPIIFTLFFAFFPSGLVLYWVTNSALSILQQWYITRRIEKAAESAKSGS
ncbi:MAG TPA: membrane protein insertase YidC [Gammaproteobacteria bacterium]|nr:membrane protein insertase YidC [Gammaproteobacteria bacterium]